MASEDTTWEELLGCNYWEGLLDPLDQSLRKLILRCGHFCQAVHDAFDNDPCSKCCGFNRYGKACFFEKVAMDNTSDYEAAPFLDSASREEAYFVQSKSGEACDPESNWIGFLVTAGDEMCHV